MAIVEKTPAEQAQNAIKSALDSVTLINQLVAAGTHSDQIDKRVKSNYQHLEIVMARQNVIDYIAENASATASDVATIESAITAGKAFAA